MFDFGCVTSRNLWINFKFSRVKLCIVVVYDPTEKNIEEKEKLWSDLERVVDRLDTEYRLYLLGDLNGWVRDRMRLSITSVFGVTGENGNGRRVKGVYM